MADTKGLLASRGAYLSAVENGETDLDHKAWYEQMVQQQNATNAEAAKSIKAGYDRVAAKERLTMQPNDVIVRLTKDADGKISHEVLLGVSDEDMIPYMEEVAEKIDRVLDASKVVSQG